jgi:hypothetical protein
MMKGRTMLAASLLLLLIIPLSQADMGIGISGNNHELHIDAFPFDYKGSFSIHNPSEEDALFTVKAVGPYDDVTSWVTIDPAIVSIGGGKYSDISYSISADEGYGGAYEVYLVATCYGDDTTQEAPSTPVSYLQTSGTIKITLDISEAAGASSKGPEHPRPDHEENPTEMTDSEASSVPNGVEAYTFDAPLYINIPQEVECGTSVPIEGGCLHGDAPHALQFIIHSPDGSRYERPLTTTVTFDEPGAWHVVLALDGQTVIGKHVSVMEAEGASYAPYIMVLAALVCVGCVLAYRKRPTDE